MTRVLDWLAFESGILTERFQARHLIANYSLLALACAIYLLGTGTWVIVAGCLPGMTIFLASVEAMMWKMKVEETGPFAIISMMQR